ncbi:MAG: hypothetical protein AAGA18_04510 [Verrucomicrobiota bacterium]
MDKRVREQRESIKQKVLDTLEVTDKRSIRLIQSDQALNWGLRKLKRSDLVTLS